MKYRILTSFLLLSVLNSFGQINIADSTAQAITYWAKGDKKNYTITVEKIKIIDSDTTSREITTYDTEIKVLNEDENSYTIEWLYKNITTNHQNPTIQRLTALTKNMKVIYKTNELGVFVEVVNWREIKDYIQKSIKALSKDIKNLPEVDQIMKQIEISYSTKEAIESVAIKDIQQFHFCHGANYKLGEVLETQFKVANILGDEPFDSYLTISLDEINEEEDNFTINVVQEVDKEQLTNTMYNYLTKNNQTTLPKREDINDLNNSTFTTTNIHGTGWVVYSVQTTTVTMDNSTRIEERIIEMK